MNQPTLFRGLHPSIRQIKAQDVERKARGPLTPQQLTVAKMTHHRAWGGRCQHEEPCATRDVCIEKIARHQRKMGYVK